MIEAALSTKNDLGEELQYSNTCQGRYEGQGINASPLKQKSMLISYLVIQPISESAMGSLRTGFQKAGRRSHDQIR